MFGGLLAGVTERAKLFEIGNLCTVGYGNIQYHDYCN